MKPEAHEALLQALTTAWARADKARAIVHTEGVAAHEAGNTPAQHRLEVIHYQIDRATATLVDAVRLIDNHMKGESK